MHWPEAGLWNRPRSCIPKYGNGTWLSQGHELDATAPSTWVVVWWHSLLFFWVHVISNSWTWVHFTMGKSMAICLLGKCPTDKICATSCFCHHPWLCVGYRATREDHYHACAPAQCAHAHIPTTIDGKMVPLSIDFAVDVNCVSCGVWTPLQLVNYNDPSCH